jgi:hypothetical protein
MSNEKMEECLGIDAIGEKLMVGEFSNINMFLDDGLKVETYGNVHRSSVGIEMVKNPKLRFKILDNTKRKLTAQIEQLKSQLSAVDNELNAVKGGIK